ncbi:MAG: tetratricopeptide repeat protein [Pirellulaceae bacterium]
MVRYEQSRRQQFLSEAEGYLDLLAGLSGRDEFEMPVRTRLAARALDVLKRLARESSWRRGHVLFLQGQAMRMCERYPEAITSLVEASQLDPENLHVWLALGWCYKRTDRLDLAVQSLEEALAIEPDEAIVHYNLACYWSLANNPLLAVAYLARAFDLDSNYRDLVGDESDFAPIRNHPDFLALTTVIV